jgi:hypothetical protein
MREHEVLDGGTTTKVPKKDASDLRRAVLLCAPI